MVSKLIFERSERGRRAVDLPALDVPEKDMEKLLPGISLRS